MLEAKFKTVDQSKIAFHVVFSVTVYSVSPSCYDGCSVAFYLLCAIVHNAQLSVKRQI